MASPGEKDLAGTMVTAAAAIRQADALLITAGAGIGVDSGLPDFRGPEGFWRAYPMYEHLGLRFEEAANPRHFRRDPGFAWGFYGHRLHLYRNTTPHRGFRLLLEWARRLTPQYFVVTSNVDGQFQKAGFDEEHIWEVHGSIHRLQCSQPCTPAIWANTATPLVDAATMRATQLPCCDACGEVARPNILMFGDGDWLAEHSDRQQARLGSFLQRLAGRRLVVLEIGAGTSLPTIRNLSESVARQFEGRCVRVNPREAMIPSPHIAVSAAALPALLALHRLQSVADAG